MSEQKPQPFSSFGAMLRTYRQKAKRTQVELSGAVEIDVATLVSYETGEKRPSEDILMLLIQHFALKDEEADEWIRLAGYGDSNDDMSYFINDDFGIPKQVKNALVQADDVKIVYTDMIQVMVNNYGVILSFLQGASVSNQPLAVARVGMSKEHAKSVLDVLKKTLEQAEVMEKVNNSPKQLSSGNNKQG